MMNRWTRGAAVLLGACALSAASLAQELTADRAPAADVATGVRPFQGMMTAISPYDADTTMARLQAEVVGRGLTVLLRVNHAAAAASVNLSLRPTQLLVFGNPRVGTLLMQCAQTAGLDLPLRVLVWTDAGGTTRVSYDSPRWIMKRQGAPDCAATEKVDDALAAIVTATVAR